MWAAPLCQSSPSLASRAGGAVARILVESFRAPNLITINEVIVARQNTRNDYACVYAANNGGDPEQDIIDCRNSTQRIAQGSKLLEPERSDNYSFGIVVQPLETLTLTLDWCRSRKKTP